MLEIRCFLSIRRVSQFEVSEGNGIVRHDILTTIGLTSEEKQRFPP